MKIRLLAINLFGAAAIAFCGPLDFATRVSCELQTASGTSLQRVTWQQGTTPLLSIEQFRLGKAISADTNTDAVVVIGPSATSQYYVAVTNQSTSGNSYLVQMPTIGTNTASGVWWYTVYFQRDGRRYWTGNGALTIEATTSTGDGLVWQTITGVSVAALQSALDAEALARASGDLVSMTNWQAVVYSMTNGAALGATALQPAATNTLAAAAAHAATEHSVTVEGGFQAGTGASASLGGAVGDRAYANYGGAVGDRAYAASGGAVGAGAYATDGGAVGAGAYATDGGAVGANAKTSDGFAGGKDAFATSDGTFFGDPIDAIQLGSGGNSTPQTLQIYTNRLLNADGTIPVERMSLHTADETAHPDIRAAVNAAPEWIGITNLAASVTVTNSYERPVYLYATGTVSVAFSGLRTPMPLYLVLRGPDSLTFPGAYYIGGGTWQTNMSNHFVVWKYGTNLFVNPVTATED